MLARRTLFAALALGALAQSALACSFMPDERPWEERLADEPVIFVGKVLSVLSREAMQAMDRGVCGPDDAAASTLMGDRDGNCVIIRVEQKIRGVKSKTFEVPQGQGADCAIFFDVGQRWLFAGNFIGGPSQQVPGLLTKRQINSIKEALK